MNNNITTRNDRSSNLELFRIITMLLIIAHHYVVNSGLLDVGGVVHSNYLSSKSLFLLIFGAFGKTGINCFVFITGYFMCKSRITVKKFAKLLFEIEFYKISIYLIFVITGYSKFSLAGFVKAVIPFTSIGQNFTGCFLIFYVLIPFLNVLIHNVSEKYHIRLLLLLCFVYVFLGTLFGNNVIYNYVTWFVVLYFVSSYIRLYPKNMFNRTAFWGLLSLLSVIFSALSVIAFAYIAEKYGRGSIFYLVMDSNKLLAFMTAFCAFMFFKNLHIKQSSFVNTVAASAFGVFLIHANGNDMRNWLWRDLLKNVEFYNSKYLVLHAVGSVIGIYIVCATIDWLRIRFIEKPLLKLWDKHENGLLIRLKKTEDRICEKLNVSTK